MHHNCNEARTLLKAFISCMQTLRGIVKISANAEAESQLVLKLRQSLFEEVLTPLQVVDFFVKVSSHRADHSKNILKLKCINFLG